jgi:hypothetical protein
MMRLRTGLGLRRGFTSKNTYITNINTPICVNCLHFIPHSDRFDNALGKCSKFGKKDLVTGDIKYEWAAICRTLDRKCGESGLYFYSKHDL